MKAEFMPLISIFSTQHTVPDTRESPQYVFVELIYLNTILYNYLNLRMTRSCIEKILRNPPKKLLELINEFCKVAGYKIKDI